MYIREAKTGIVHTRFGQIEFCHYLGTGIPVVFIHGTPGDCTQAEFYLKDIIQKGYEVISISRPGYGKTKCTSISRNFYRQAYLIESVLEALHIDEDVVVYAVSGGAAIAYRFVDLFRYRCCGLILESPVVGPWNPSDMPAKRKLLNKIYTNGVLIHLFELMLRLAPRLAVALFLNNFGKYSFSTSWKMSYQICQKMDVVNNIGKLLDTFRSSYDKGGFDNDVDEFKYLGIDWFVNIDIPVLVLHGRQDRDVPLEDVREFFRGIKQTRLVEVDGHHILPMSNDSGLVSRTKSLFLEGLNGGRNNIQVK